jgi:hypothetical protein
MAEKFHEGDREFQSDQRWWELVEEAERRALTEAAPARSDAEVAGFWEAGANQPGAAAEQAPAPARTVQRRAIASLSIEYVDELSLLSWDVKAFETDETDPDLGELAWVLARPRAAEWVFLVNPRHAVFQSATLTPADALYAELAHAAADAVRERPAPPTFASILAGLRERYATAAKLDPVTLAACAQSALTAVAQSLSRGIDAADAVALFGGLAGAEQDAIWERMVGKSVREPNQVIGSGKFLEYAPRWVLHRFFEQHPELFLDGRYWDAPYERLVYAREDLTAAAREQVVRFYSSLLTDAIWLAEQNHSDPAEATRARLLRSALALELLETEVTNTEDEG